MVIVPLLGTLFLGRTWLKDMKRFSAPQLMHIFQDFSIKNRHRKIKAKRMPFDCEGIEFAQEFEGVRYGGLRDL